MKNWLTIGLVSLLAVAAGFIIYQQSNRPEATADVTETAPIASAEAAAPAKNSAPTVLPEFSLMNREGQMQSIRSWPGKSLIVNFWATWCGPCRKEIPLLMDLSKTEAKNGFQVVGIAIDFRDDVLKYAREIGIEYPLLMGEQEGFAAANAFGVESMGLPFTVFTDAKGRIVTMFVGELTRPKLAALLDGVRQVNLGKATPEAARAAILVALDKLPGHAH